MPIEVEQHPLADPELSRALRDLANRAIGQDKYLLNEAAVTIAAIPSWLSTAEDDGDDIFITVWPDIFRALGGMYAFPYHHDDLEKMKRFASGHIANIPRAGAAANFVPYLLLHAFAHYVRAVEVCMHDRQATWLDNSFPRGFTFRVYLGAWLWSVAIQNLSVTPAHLAAIQETTGVAPLPHPLMPKGSSIPLYEDVSTGVELIPVNKLTVEAVERAL